MTAVGAVLSYGALWTRVSGAAHALAARVSPGERVLLLLPTGIDYIVRFLGLLALPIRPGDQLRELVPLVAAQMARMIERRVLTPELLSRSCASGRDTGLPRLFDIAFQCHEEHKDRLQWLARRRCSRSTRSPPFDLTLSVQAGPRGLLGCHFEYATELFEVETMQRLASDYASVLATLAFHAHAYAREVRVSASHEPMQGGDYDYTVLAVSEA